MTTYNLANIRRTAANAICAKALLLGRVQVDKVLRGISIYVKNTTKRWTSCDIRDWHEKQGDSDRYFQLARNMKARCRAGRATILPTGVNKWTGWHDENRQQMKRRIRNYCNKKFARPFYVIKEFKGQQGTGKLRAKFSCTR